MSPRSHRRSFPAMDLQHSCTFLRRLWDAAAAAAAGVCVCVCVCVCASACVCDGKEGGRDAGKKVVMWRHPCDAPIPPPPLLLLLRPHPVPSLHLLLHPPWLFTLRRLECVCVCVSVPVMTQPGSRDCGGGGGGGVGWEEEEEEERGRTWRRKWVTRSRTQQDERAARRRPTWRPKPEEEAFSSALTLRQRP